MLALMAWTFQGHQPLDFMPFRFLGVGGCVRSQGLGFVEFRMHGSRLEGLAVQGLGLHASLNPQP